MKFKKILGFKVTANLVIWIMLIGGSVFTLGFWLSLMIARQELTKEVDAKVKSQFNYLEAYVDGRLQRIEDAGYSLASTLFGNCTRDESGNSSVRLDSSSFVRLMPEECYDKIRRFMEANPIVCGVAIEFERGEYADVKSTYGFTPYVTRLSGEFKCLDLGMITDSFTWEWYIAPTTSGKSCWISPFRDSSINHVIACFTIPVYKDGQKFAVLAIDIDTESFGVKCDEISPYPSARVTMLDRSFKFISHPDPTCLMKDVNEVDTNENIAFDDNIKAILTEGKFGRVSLNVGGKDVLFYFSPITRTGWTITIQCPEDEIYGGVNKMKLTTTLIAIVSVLVMVISLLLVFRKLQSIISKETSIENELKVASEIQMDMLPKLYPSFQVRKDVDIYGFQKSAKSVGGDLYDFFIRDNKLFFCIGDVSGKGVPAALYMADVLSLFRGLGHLNDNPGEIMRLINQTVSEGNTSSMFCTLFVGVLDLVSGRMKYCNGGHNAPLVKQSGANADFHFAKIKVNIPVGVMIDYAYQSDSTVLNSGDIILLYTDGVTEAEDTKKRLFGDNALREVFARIDRSSPIRARDYVEGVFEALIAHTSGAEQSDDITMLAIAYRGN